MKVTTNWEGHYQSGKTGWDRGEISPVLQKWLNKGTLQRCKILIPGCGHGHEVVELARLGFAVTAIDIAANPVLSLRNRLADQDLTAEIIQTDLLDWNPPSTFDAIYEQTCLCALEPQDWSAYEKKLLQWLKPEGALFAIFMQTNQEGGPPYHCEISEMQRLFSSAWKWPEGSGSEVPHPNGLEELAFVLHRENTP
jgi:cyclopropane fatty-acyl-phospholipid synthase-like methyltransferase